MKMDNNTFWIFFWILLFIYLLAQSAIDTYKYSLNKNCKKSKIELKINK